MTNIDNVENVENAGHDIRLTGSQINWGNLEPLVGTWQGANGFNMIAVPDQHGGFRLLVVPGPGRFDRRHDRLAAYQREYAYQDRVRSLLSP